MSPAVEIDLEVVVADEGAHLTAAREALDRHRLAFRAALLRRLIAAGAHDLTAASRRRARRITPYPVRIPKHLLELADLRAAEEQIDRSTALRQLLHAGALGYVLDVLAKGRISLSKAAELLALPRA